MYYFEEAVAEATAAAGMRALCGQTVLKFPAPDAASFEDSLARAREFIARWKGHPLIVPGVAPHAPYTCTPEILRACAELAGEFDVPLHTHLAETLLEVEQSRREHGMPVVPWVKKQRLFDAKVLAAHCVHVDEGEMRALKDAGAGVAHNPTSNLKLGSGVAPVAKMLELGRERRHRHRRRRVEQRPRHVRGDAAGGAARQGHRRRSDRAAGAQSAGDGDAHRGAARCTSATSPARSSPASAPTSSSSILDQAAQRAPLRPRSERDLLADRLRREVDRRRRRDVQRPVADARPRLLTLDEDELREAARDVARRIDAFLIEREQSVLQKLVAIGGAVEQESFEVQVKARLASAGSGPDTR